jgi:hypothetical protein
MYQAWKKFQVLQVIFLNIFLSKKYFKKQLQSYFLKCYRSLFFSFTKELVIVYSTIHAWDS